MEVHSDAWQSGDTAAFESLFRQYQMLVFKNAYLITGSQEEAEDVLQEVFVSAWRARQTFNPGKGKLTTWLHKITVNKCIERKRGKRVTTVSLEETDLTATQANNDVLLSREEYDRLIKAMNSLDTRHRVVLVLRYFNDLSYEEIAQTVGIPLGTVKSRMNQALKLLRGQMGAPA